ncbi:MAG: hypothetical protein R2854_04085 [Caldilineaceae bacterium]
MPRRDPTGPHPRRSAAPYYVHPAILDRYRRTLAEAATEWPGLSAAEATTLAVLLDELDVQLALPEPWP